MQLFSDPHLLFRKNMKKLSIGLHFGDYPLMGLGVHFRVIARKANWICWVWGQKASGYQGFARTKEGERYKSQGGFSWQVIEGLITLAGAPSRRSWMWIIFGLVFWYQVQILLASNGRWYLVRSFGGDRGARLVGAVVWPRRLSWFGALHIELWMGWEQGACQIDQLRIKTVRPVQRLIWSGITKRSGYKSRPKQNFGYVIVSTLCIFYMVKEIIPAQLSRNDPEHHWNHGRQRTIICDEAVWVEPFFGWFATLERRAFWRLRGERGHGMTRSSCIFLEFHGPVFYIDFPPSPRDQVEICPDRQASISRPDPSCERIRWNWSWCRQRQLARQLRTSRPGCEGIARKSGRDKCTLSTHILCIKLHSPIWGVRYLGVFVKTVRQWDCYSA